MKKILLCFAAALFLLAYTYAQKQAGLVYVDKQGVLRWTKGKAEASFFGVNYTVPFAYGYRSHKALGIDPEKAIDADVYHMQRLGLDAFRVHVWDVEISDSLGNLLDNEHLRLFDYLVARLKERNIKILVTPIAFWGNGYPEPDTKTNGFASVYGKGPSVVLEAAIKAQENYMKQFFSHVNPYTKLAYTDDPDVIAAEINNEPHHSGPKGKATEYVNRLTAAVRSTGWKKPVFYNISESPGYADAVVKANVEGHSFQWYPTGLVANRELKGNYLPNADKYYIPFSDTIPAFTSRARMVYEFDAGDIMQPVMYPAMIRSYRTAGFQWATQFAYDPMYTAHANTEYQTHYLSLPYTPAKAISLLIASKAFHKLPRFKSYGVYPANEVFDVFKVSYSQQLSVMNDNEEFYYTGSTDDIPKNTSRLKHIAGTGSSAIVQYEGTGAYFLDKLDNGTWKLEVMPDAVRIGDPFERASPKKEVTRIFWRSHKMQLSLPGLQAAFVVRGINAGNNYSTSATGGSFYIQPGVYIIAPTNAAAERHPAGVEFFAPAPSASEPFVAHVPMPEVSAGKPFTLEATITGIDTADKVSVEMRNTSGKWKTISLQLAGAYVYKGQVPAEFVTPGMVNYRIMLQKLQEQYTFPGAFKGNPYAWDEYRNESWQTFVASPESHLELFNAGTDRTAVMPYNPDWRNNTIEYIAAERARQLVLKASMNKGGQGQSMGWQFYFGDKIAGRKEELLSMRSIVVRARSQQELPLKIALITGNADAWSVTVPLTREWKEIDISLNSLQSDSFLLLPRPYPGFLPLRFKSTVTRPWNVREIEKIEFSIINSTSHPGGVEVESVWLKRQ